MPNFDPRSRSEVNEARGTDITGRGGAIGRGASIGRSVPPRGPFTRTMSPVYNPEDFRLSDLGITGALGRLIEGTFTGDMWSGRTPIGFSESQSRDLGTSGGGLGNTGGKDLFGFGRFGVQGFDPRLRLEELLRMMGMFNPLTGGVQAPGTPQKAVTRAVDPIPGFNDPRSSFARVMRWLP